MLSIRSYPEILIVVYAAIGRSPYCSTLQAFRGAQTSFRYRRLEASYLSSDSLFRLSESDSVGFHRWTTPEGNYWIPGGSDRVLPILVAQQNSDIYGTGRYGVQRGDIVLDCGAHVGVFTRKALNLGASQVLAIEPASNNVECLSRNFKLEISQGSVSVCPKGVWDRETVLELQTSEANSASDSFVMKSSPSVGQTYEVRVTTVDKLVAEMGLTRVDFIKMDVKGSAERALEGAKDTLKRYKPRLAISTEETADDPERIISLCRRLQPGYTVECGYCAIGNGLVQPAVLFLH